MSSCAVQARGELMFTRFVFVLMGALGAFILTAPAHAQTPQPEGQPPLFAGPDGFGLQSANGDFRLQIGLLVQADGRFALDDATPTMPDTFALRRLRPYLRG